MPPKSSLTGSFSATDVNNEVVCPLINNDGSNCRKRCSGDKKYRSIQEHIRRAHPQSYIPKLPATEESFRQMINTPPSARPPPPPPPVAAPSQTYSSPAYGHDRDSYSYPPNALTSARNMEDHYPAAATAAVALAQLHNQRTDSDWESDPDYPSESDMRRRMRPSVELPSIQSQLGQPTTNPFMDASSRHLFPSAMASSPPERSSTLPPIERRESLQKKNRANRPRKSSITHNSQRPRHEKGRSRDYGARLNVDGRKAFSAEPPAPAAAAAKSNKRWEDLIEAAASATEADSDRDITPTPQSPNSIKRSSLPPLHASIAQNQSYKASPLARTLTPPPPQVLSGPPPFPHVEAAGRPMESGSAHSSHTSASGQNFHISASGLSSSDSATSPTYYNSQHTSRDSQSSGNGGVQVQIYCANCRRPNALLDSFACTGCISGFCMDCMWMLNGDVRPGVRGRPCPRCGALGAKYKPIRLEIR